MNSKEDLKWLKEHHEYLIKQYFDTPFVSKEEAMQMANERFSRIEKDLEQLEKENQELKETINDLQKDYDSLDFEQAELYKENNKLKQVIEILKDRKHILKYNGIAETYELGWLTQEEYELLKEELE